MLLHSYCSAISCVQVLRVKTKARPVDGQAGWGANAMSSGEGSHIGLWVPVRVVQHDGGDARQVGAQTAAGGGLQEEERFAAAQEKEFQSDPLQLLTSPLQEWRTVSILLHCIL